MLKEYLITGKKSLNNSMRLGYNSDELLVEISLQGDMDERGRSFLIKRAPTIQHELEQAGIEHKWTIKALEQKVSFEEFYEEYANKVGRKPAELKWKRLKKEDRIKAMMYIDKYKNHLKLRPGQQQMYPATYLNSEPWND